MSHPQRLGKYQITEVLGEGAMGVVYKGFDPDIRRVVALKTIRRQLTDGSDFAESIAARFRNEAQAAGRLSHPGIVSVYEFGEDTQVAYIAMEFVEGESIAHYLANQVRFTDEDVPGLMSQLLDALDHAHSQGVWHRDIKPANVILAPAGKLKVADFGIARVDAGGLTQTHMMLGTPAYMAPEQFLGATVDARCDIYSAGVLLYVLLTGKPPFTGPTDALMYKVVHEAPTAPSTLDGISRPRFYDELIAKALAKKPEERYPSARAFKEALTEAIGRPFDTTTWDQTIVRAPKPATARPVPSPTGGGGSVGTTAARQWDRAVLTEAQSTLAHYVGPMATVMVRRAARECDTESALYAMLAEQVTDPAARRAFLGRLTQGGTTGTGRTSVVVGTTAAGLGEDLLAKAQQLLAHELGPIARVVVKKAAANAPDRNTFFLRLSEAVTQPDARARVLAALERLSP